MEYPGIIDRLQHAPRIDALACRVMFTETGVQSGDVDIARRLIASYRAIATRLGAGSAPGERNLWHMLADEHQGEYVGLLQAGDPEALAEHLRWLHTHSIAEGFAQGRRVWEMIQTDQVMRSVVAIQHMDQLVSLAESLGALLVELPEHGAPLGETLAAHPDAMIDRIEAALGIELVPPVAAAGLLGLNTKRGCFGGTTLRALYAAVRMRHLLRDAKNPRICEIGGGTGDTAYWCRQLGLADYTIVDLPVVGSVQGWFLGRTLGPDGVCMFGEDPSSSAVRLVPDMDFDSMPDGGFDLVFNQDSLPEMGWTVARAYIDRIPRKCRGLFLSINHEAQVEGRPYTYASVPELTAGRRDYHRLERNRAWLRRGFVEEVYRVGP